MGAKPIVKQIAPWDARDGYLVRFSIDGMIPVANRVIIYNAASMAIVYDKTQKTNAYSHSIASEAFKANAYDENANGNKFCLQVEVYGANGQKSFASEKVYFWCLTKPKFEYTKPYEDEIVYSSTIEVNLKYFQMQGEKLYNYRHYLYNEAKVQINVSKTFFDEEGLSYMFKGLNNRETYYVRAQGETKNGIILDTGYVQVTTNYAESEYYDVLSLSSDLNATVTGTTNMIIIDANEDSEDFEYTDSYVHIIDRTITYEHNYRISGDFQMILKFTRLKYNGVILSMYSKSNPKAKITIDSYMFEDGLRYCLKASNGVGTYVLYTEPIADYNQDDFMRVTVKRQGNFYSITANIDNE